MKVELRAFQKVAVTELLNRLDTARYGWRRGQRQAVGLAAPTGAGKTIIATAVIERLLFGSEEPGNEVPPDEGAVVLWVTDLPELNLQTQDKMLEASSELRLDRLPIIEGTFNKEILSPRRVYFLNTQKLGARADLVKSGPLIERPFTFWDVVRKTIEAEGRTLYLVVDEAHRGMTEARDVAEANSIIQRFIKGYPDGAMPPVPIVLGISATPERYQRVVEGSGRNTSYWAVPPEDVRASGLIKERTLAEFAGERQTDAMALFPEAVQAWKDATDQWAAYDATYSAVSGEPLVVPALIVQVENETPDRRRVTQTDLEGVVKAVTDIAGNLPDEAFAHAFGEARDETVGGRKLRYLEPSKIARDSDTRIVFFKASLGTGWDCPRAEVLFSFRRAVDPTSIAQMIGRMVRTPLARRIEENDALNVAFVFLPHYNEAAVRSIVAYLTENGNEAIAGTIGRRRETATLPIRPGSEAIVAALQALPQYLVPTPRARQEVRVLVDLANFLASTGLDADAFSRELAGLTKLLLDRRAALAGDAKFEAGVNDQGEITIQRGEWLTGEGALTTSTTPKRLVATQESIGRLFAAAGRRLTSDLAAAYVRARLGDEPTASGRARLEAYALSEMDAVSDELNRAAQGRLEELIVRYGRAATGLSPERRGRFKTIIRQAPSPSLVEWTLPDPAIFVRGPLTLPLHLYADENGEASFDFRSTWEEPTIREELAKPDVRAWLRNPERDWAFCVPWREGNTWKPMYPDFLLVREDQGGLVVDVIDPHDPTRDDAVGKAKGLSDLARNHADRFGHIDVVAKIGRRYRRLHLDRAEIRQEVDRVVTNEQLIAVYERRG